MPSLPDLPPETVTTIFESMSSFATASALSKTSRRFHAIFVLRLHSITLGILGRSIICFEEACELVDAQAMAITMDYHPGESDRVAALYVDSTVRLVANAEKAADVAAHFNTATPRDLAFASPHCSMTESENMTFLRAYYRAMTFASRARQYVWNVLDWRVLDIFQVSDILRFLDDWAEYKASLNRNPYRIHDSIPVAGDPHMDRAGRELKALCGDLMDLKVNKGLLASHRTSRLKYPFIGDPAYKDAVGAKRGLRLSQIYPSLSKDIKERLPYLQ